MGGRSLWVFVSTFQPNNDGNQQVSASEHQFQQPETATPVQRNCYALRRVLKNDGHRLLN
jgi:hypothetical protein